jgi:hypothetical protein
MFNSIVWCFSSSNFQCSQIMGITLYRNMKFAISLQLCLASSSQASAIPLCVNGVSTLRGLLTRILAKLRVSNPISYA